jgi:hypothetical protein
VQNGIRNVGYVRIEGPARVEDTELEDDGREWDEEDRRRHEVGEEDREPDLLRAAAIPLRTGVLQRSPPGRFPAESASRLAPRMVRTARRTTRHSLPDQVPRRTEWSVGRASSDGCHRKRP